MPAEINEMLAQALKAARLKTPPREVRPDAKRESKKMSQGEAAKWIKAKIEQTTGKSRRLSGSMLTKMENMEEGIPRDVAQAAEAVYGLPENTLTKFYGNAVESLNDPETYEDPWAFVIQEYSQGGGVKPWNRKRKGMGKTMVYAFLKGKDMVQLDVEGLNNLPGGALIAFERDVSPHEDTWLLLSRKNKPDEMVIRYISPTAPTKLVCLDDVQALLLSEWDVQGWAVAWAPKQGHDFPNWQVVKNGIGPTYQR